MNKGFLENSYIIPINIDVYNTDVIFIYNMGNKKIKKKLKEIIKHEYHEKLKTLKINLLVIDICTFMINVMKMHMKNS